MKDERFCRSLSRRESLARIAVGGMAAIPLGHAIDAAGSTASSFSEGSSSHKEQPRWFFEPLDRAMLQALELSKESRVLDAGCGRGEHLILFAESLPEGTVTGIDNQASMVQTSSRRLEQEKLAGRAVVQTANIYQLPFADHSFDLAWTSHVLINLGDPLKAVKELIRVCRSGGRVVVREDQYEMQMLPADIDLGPPGLEQRVLAAKQRATLKRFDTLGRLPFGWPAMLKEAGLTNVSASSFLFQAQPPWTPVQVSYLRWWLGQWANFAENDQDRETIAAILDPNSPREILKRDDLHITKVATIYVATVG